MTNVDNTTGFLAEMEAPSDVTTSGPARRLANDLAMAHTLYAAEPDIRRNKVEEMKARLAAGEFHPTAEAIAGAMISSARRFRGGS